MVDPAKGRYKAFLFVGIAYFIAAVLGPLVAMLLNSASWSFPLKGIGWSLSITVIGDFQKISVSSYCNGEGLKYL